MRAVLTGLVLLTLARNAPPEPEPTSRWEPPPAPTTSDSIAALVAEFESWPLARGANPQAVATAVLRHSVHLGLDPHLTVAVIRVENPWMVTDTVSYAGAVGLMQVIPRYWSGVFPRCGNDLSTIEDNVCVGTRVLRFYVEREGRGAMSRALLAYNGCTDASRKCGKYPALVMASLPGLPSEQAIQ